MELLEFDREAKKRELEKLIKRYKPFMEDLYKSPLGRVVKINEAHCEALAIKLKQTEAMKKFLLHEAGTQADLGLLSRQALDIVSVNFNTDPLNIIAGTQEMPSPTGVIIYKKVRANTTRGNVTSGDILRDPRTAPDRYARNFSDDTVSSEVAATTVAGTLNYAYTLQKNPIRRGTVYVTLSSGSNFCTDQGLVGNETTGQLLGIGISGTLVYDSGTITINFATDPGNGVVVSVRYATNFEENGSYPRIQSLWDNKLLEARVFTLGQEMGVIESFQLKKQLGVDADTDMIQTLSEELMAEITQNLTYQMYAQAIGTTNFNRRLPSGVSDYLHVKALHIKIAQASGQISKNAGRGVGNVLVGDNDWCSYLESASDDKNQFEVVGVPSSGIHIRGIYKGNIPVICDPSLAINPSTGLAYTDGIYRGYMSYRGTNNYDVAAVFGSYLPFFTAGNVPVLNNLLKKQGIAGAMGAVDNLIPKFTTKIHIIDQAY